jgi:hypothetical protein
MSYQRICIFAHKSSFSSRYICGEMRVKIEFKNVGRLSNGEGSYVALSSTFRMLRNSMERWLGSKLQLSLLGKNRNIFNTVNRGGFAQGVVKLHRA